MIVVSKHTRTVATTGEVFEPTPQQIREQCEAIQQEWSDRERTRRLVVAEQRWTVPEATAMR